MKKKFVPPPFHLGKSEEQNKDFEELFQAYWRYVYKYEVGHLEDFTPDEPWYKRSDFVDQLQEEGMTIKVTQGY